MEKCNECKRKFPKHLIQPIFMEGKYYLMCPLCALTQRNELAGLPKDTPFQGEIANAMWEEAKAFIEKK